jgi:prepilin-type N-terminal cleavage/methylation domain-containing protein
MRKRSDDRGIEGFTLFETLSVIAIIGIILVITIPSFSRYIDSSRLRGASNELAADIHYTRSLALSRRKTYNIDFQPDRYRIIETSTGNVVKTRTMPPGFVFASSANPRFYAWGLTDAADITISKGSKARSLVLLPNGNVSCN